MNIKIQATAPNTHTWQVPVFLPKVLSNWLSYNRVCGPSLQALHDVPNHNNSLSVNNQHSKPYEHKTPFKTSKNVILDLPKLSGVRIPLFGVKTPQIPLFCLQVVTYKITGRDLHGAAKTREHQSRPAIVHHRHSNLEPNFNPFMIRIWKKCISQNL